MSLLRFVYQICTYDGLTWTDCVDFFFSFASKEKSPASRFLACLGHIILLLYRASFLYDIPQGDIVNVVVGRYALKSIRLIILFGRSRICRTV